MPRPEPTKADLVNSALKGVPSYSDEALLKMVNLLYDPMIASLCRETGLKEEIHLLGLTKINSSREAYHWATQIGKEAARNPGRKWGVGKVIRIAFLVARRSLDMKAFMLGVGLAQEQNLAKETEEPGEASEW